MAETKRIGGSRRRTGTSRTGIDPLRRAMRKATEARRTLAAMDGGRAWINGAEVGGPDPRYAHLNRSYD